MKKLLCAALLAASAFASPAMAADFSFTGSFDDPNDVQLFDFTVGANSTVTLRTYSYAGGTNAAGQLIQGGNFDPILALFDSNGLRIGENDDGGFGNVPTDPITGNPYDTFLSVDLLPGTYTVSVMAFSNFSIGPNLSDGFQNSGSFNGRGQNWAFDVLNVDTAVAPGVPEPATWAMMIGGFGLVGAAMRRRVTNVAYA